MSSSSLWHTRRASSIGLLGALLIGLGACADRSPVEPEAPISGPLAAASGTSAAGAIAFNASCASCHTSKDAFDLAVFRFADRDIIRRAVFHVDTTTAKQILQYIRSLKVASVSRDRRPFQVPKASSDEDFARRLFGRDAWPASLDEAALLRLDPTKVAAAVDFPRWSDEASDLDWMGNRPLPEAILSYNNHAPRLAIDAYFTNRSDARLLTAFSRVRAALFDPVSGACTQINDGIINAPLDCFEQLRWLSNLGAQHVLRRGMTAAALPTTSTLVQSTWWDVGQAARRSLIKNKTPIPNAEGNWVSWMYLGWVLAPSSRASTYTASGLTRVGLPRHATFVAVRSLVSRSATASSAYADLRTTVSVAPMPWLEAAATSAIRALEQRQARGWKPTSVDGIASAIDALDDAVMILNRRLGTTKAAPLVTRITALRAL